MMNMKRLTACLLAVLMVLAMTACGGNNNASSPASDAGNNGAGTGNDTPAPAGTVTIKVGGIGPLTGDLAQYGTATEWEIGRAHV